MTDPKTSVTFILSGTQFASNLGGAARVLKNMGFERLALVRPVCEVGVEARTAAMRGDSLLDSARFHPSLLEAKRDVDLLVGTSGGLGGRHPRRVDCRSLAEEIVPRYLPNRIGVAFGCEGNGLRHDEMELCEWLVEIPTGSDYGSLNLSQAVAIVAYDLHCSMTRLTPGGFLHLAPPEQVRDLLSHLERLLASGRLPASTDIDQALRRLEKIAGRARLEQEDINLIRSLTQVGD